MKEVFHSRFGLIVALVGMAVGTGNIWRFPRIMAQNGGGAFLIPWFLFLFLWSIPLLMVEFSFGQKIRKGVVGVFYEKSKGRLTWMGGFICLCTLGIMFYYSVVTGWCLNYFLTTVTGSLLKEDVALYWEIFTTQSKLPLFYHLFCILLCVGIVSRGAQRGIELLSKILIPALFVILLILAGYATTLKGHGDGLAFIFDFQWERLKDYKVWLEGLTQSAWSTGAGWGLALSYACYARAKDSPITTPCLTAVSNNVIEILAVLIILPTLFTFFPLTEVIRQTSEGNTGLTFIALPGLFQQMPAGRWVSIFFFLALFFAAFTSLVSMFELGARYLMDLKTPRALAIWLLAIIAALLGIPSAMNMSFFENQDWVWGVGLLVSGYFFTMLVHHVGAKEFAEDFLGVQKPWFTHLCKFVYYCLIPFQFFVLIAWWFMQARSWDPEGWLHPFKTFSVGTCLFQWSIILFSLILLNQFINKHLQK